MPESRCKIKLQKPPSCGDTPAMRGWVMCHAREIGVKEHGQALGPAMRNAWQEARKACKK